MIFIGHVSDLDCSDKALPNDSVRSANKKRVDMLQGKGRDYVIHPRVPSDGERFLEIVLFNLKIMYVYVTKW